MGLGVAVGVGVGLGLVVVTFSSVIVWPAFPPTTTTGEPVTVSVTTPLIFGLVVEVDEEEEEEEEEVDDCDLV